MIRVRPMQEKDAAKLEKLVQIPGFFNLSGDRESLLKKIEESGEAFSRKKKELWKNRFLFAAVDQETETLLGSSTLTAQHGTPDSPHFFFQVAQEKRYSKSTKTGFIHTTLKLSQDIDGPTELGGLVVDSESRKHGTGKVISFARFLFLWMYPSLFKERLIAELLPPLNRKGLSPLWEAIGRRFTNMDYWEADELCAKNKEFILSLFPRSKIYATLFTADARNAIGGVSKDTEPALHLLRTIGFKYTDQIDPFDGGPHLHAKLEEVTLFKKIETLSYTPTLKADSESPEGVQCLVAPGREGMEPKDFQALALPAHFHDGKFSPVNSEDRKILETSFKLKVGERLFVLPLRGNG